jgi:hypothetical protein
LIKTKRKKKLLIGPKAMEKRLYKNLENIYNGDKWELMDIETYKTAARMVMMLLWNWK